MQMKVVCIFGLHSLFLIAIWSNLQQTKFFYYFAVCTSPINIHVPCLLHPPPPQFYITLVFHFLWVLRCILREIEEYAHSKFFWRTNKVYYEDVQMENLAPLSCLIQKKPFTKIILLSLVRCVLKSKRNLVICVIHLQGWRTL